MGQKKFGRINGSPYEGGIFFTRNCVWPFCQAAKKSGRNNDRGDRITEVVLRRGFTAQQTWRRFRDSNPGQ